MTLIASSPHEGTLSHQPQPHVKSPLRPSSAAPSKRGSERSNSPARPQPPPSSSSSSPASQEATALQNPAWAHRSHQTTLPCANRLLQRKWDVAAQRDHRRKVRTARASIDNEPPKKYSHLVSQARKRRDEYDYAAKLYSENKNLLRRIKRQISVPREFSPNRMTQSRHRRFDDEKARKRPERTEKESIAGASQKIERGTAATLGSFGPSLRHGKFHARAPTDFALFGKHLALSTEVRGREGSNRCSPPGRIPR
ncbi:hypothetical protein DFJ73DRAFT_227383 [Zopfochytrium polystomum]|nr:hypothetical protein DFJ73DRAFT_227383 [Zopfochytrium polystomum]